MSFKYKVKESYSLEEVQGILEQKEQFDLKSYVPKSEFEQVNSKLLDFEKSQKTQALKEEFMKHNGDITLFNKFQKLYEGEEMETFKQENNFLFKENIPNPINTEKEEEIVPETKERV